MSTIVGMLTLAFVSAYIITTFFKTMFLVITFGILHSLVFLPVALALLMPTVERLSGHLLNVLQGLIARVTDH